MEREKKKKKSNYFEIQNTWKNLSEKKIFNRAITVGKRLGKNSVLLTDLLETSNCFSSLTDCLDDA